MVQPARADARLELVDMDVLDLDLFPPLDEWSEDDWDEAILITRTHRTAEGMRSGEIPSRPWAEIKAELGLDE